MQTHDILMLFILLLAGAMKGVPSQIIPTPLKNVLGSALALMSVAILIAVVNGR